MQIYKWFWDMKKRTEVCYDITSQVGRLIEFKD